MSRLGHFEFTLLNFINYFAWLYKDSNYFSLSCIIHIWEVQLILEIVIIKEDWKNVVKNKKRTDFSLESVVVECKDVLLVFYVVSLMQHM